MRRNVAEGARLTIATDERRSQLAARAPASHRSRWALRRFVYSQNMSAAATDNARGPAGILAWRRVRFTLGISALFGLMLSVPSETAALVVVVRAMLVGLVALLAFGLFERWPQRLPNGWRAGHCSCWASSLRAVWRAVRVLGDDRRRSAVHGEPEAGHRLSACCSSPACCSRPWIAMAALVRQRDAFARDQALAFELERSELERKALDARLRLLQAQVEPHFLFNTLANVQALVDAGSPTGVGGAEEPDRLPARRRAAPARAGDDAWPGAGSSSAPTSR